MDGLFHDGYQTRSHAISTRYYKDAIHEAMEYIHENDDDQQWIKVIQLHGYGLDTHAYNNVIDAIRSISASSCDHHIVGIDSSSSSIIEIFNSIAVQIHHHCPVSLRSDLLNDDDNDDGDENESDEEDSASSLTQSRKRYREEEEGQGTGGRIRSMDIRKDRYLPVFDRIERYWAIHSKCIGKSSRMRKSSFASSSANGGDGIDDEIIKPSIVLVVDNPDHFAKDTLQKIVDGVIFLRKSKGMRVSLVFDVSAASCNGVHEYLQAEQTSMMKIRQIHVCNPRTIFDEYFDLLIDESFPLLLGRDVLCYLAEKYTLEDMSIRAFSRRVQFVALSHICKLRKLMNSVADFSSDLLLSDLARFLSSGLGAGASDSSDGSSSMDDCSIELMKLLAKLPSVKTRADNNPKLKKCVDSLVRSSPVQADVARSFRKYLRDWLAKIHEIKLNRAIAIEVLGKFKPGQLNNSRSILTGKMFADTKDECRASLMEMGLEPLMDLVSQWRSVLDNHPEICDQVRFPSQNLRRVKDDIQTSIQELREHQSQKSPSPHRGKAQPAPESVVHVTPSPSDAATKTPANLKSYNPAKRRDLLVGQLLPKLQHRSPAAASSNQGIPDAESGPGTKADLVNWIMKFLQSFEGTFLPRSFSEYPLPLIELFSFDDRNGVESSFDAQPRESQISALDDLDDSRSGQCRDTRIAFRILRESQTHPLSRKSFYVYDWYLRFCHEISGGESKPTKKSSAKTRLGDSGELKNGSNDDDGCAHALFSRYINSNVFQARFLQSVSELHHLGLYKPGKKGSGLIEKTFFEGALSQ